MNTSIFDRALAYACGFENRSRKSTEPMLGPNHTSSSGIAVGAGVGMSVGLRVGLVAAVDAGVNAGLAVSGGTEAAVGVSGALQPTSSTAMTKEARPTDSDRVQL